MLLNNRKASSRHSSESTVRADYAGSGFGGNEGGGGEHDTDELAYHYSDYSLHSVRVALTKPLQRILRGYCHRGRRRPAYDDSGLNRVTRANVRHQLSIRENPLFAAAELNDVDLLTKCIRSIKRRDGTLTDLDDDETDGPGIRLPISRMAKFNYDDRTDLGGTAYHIALQHNNTEVASRLLQTYPDYAHMTYTGSLNKGQHALHIAVVNQNLELVKHLVACGANVNEPRCTGQFFNPSSKHCQVYWGAHVLSFAVCLHQKETVSYLIKEAGANVDITDERGNTVLHLLILQADQKASVEMYRYMVDDLVVGSRLTEEANRDNLTPIQLAAKEANIEFFQELLQRRRHVHWTYGPVSSCVYPLKGIDTHDQNSSVLELLALNEKPASIEMLRLSPIKDILSAKWRQFGFLYFLVWLAIYLCNIIILTVVVRYRPVYCPNATNATDLLLSGSNSTKILDIDMTFSRLDAISGMEEEDTMMPGSISFKNEISDCSLKCFPMKKRKIFASGEESAYRTSGDFARLFFEIIVILGVVISLWYEVPDVKRRGFKVYLTNVGSGSFQVLSWVYALFIFISVILRLVEHDGEEITLAIAVVLGWFFMLFFARGFAFLGPYISIIQTILRTDIFRFLLIFSVTIISFSGVVHAVFLESRPLQPVEFISYSDCFIYLFRLAIGITEFSVDTYRVAPAAGFATALLVVYVILGFLLLIQLLIAMMNATHQRVEKRREGVWEKQLASLILLLERRLPQRLRIRTGFPGKHYSLGKGPDDDTWFIRVVEHGEMNKITRQVQPPYNKRRRIALRRKNESNAKKLQVEEPTPRLAGYVDQYVRFAGNGPGTAATAAAVAAANGAGRSHRSADGGAAAAGSSVEVGVGGNVRPATGRESTFVSAARAARTSGFVAAPTQVRVPPTVTTTTASIEEENVLVA